MTDNNNSKDKSEVGKEPQKLSAGDQWLKYVSQFEKLKELWDQIPEPLNVLLRQQIDIFAGKYPPQSESELLRLREEVERLKEEPCPKCGHGTKSWPRWEDWQEKLLPILTRFADQSASAYNYGDVWNAIRKLIVGPMESRIKELEQQSATVLMNIDTKTIEAVYLDTHKALQACRENRNLAPFTFPISGLEQQLHCKDDLVTGKEEL
jgi:hypothetical protein